MKSLLFAFTVLEGLILVWFVIIVLFALLWWALGVWEFLMQRLRLWWRSEQ